MNFESNLKRLEEIVEKLESGECGIDEATTLFDEGKEIAKLCFEKLDANKGKITELVGELDCLTEKELTSK